MYNILLKENENVFACNLVGITIKFIQNINNLDKKMEHLGNFTKLLSRLRDTNLMYLFF